MEDRPKRIKMQVFPADNLDIEVLLQDLHRAGFILRYEANNNRYIQIVNFSKHQNPHINEKPSEIPAPAISSESTIQVPEQHDTNPADSFNLIPDSLQKEAPVGALTSQQQKDEFWKIGLPLLTSQGLEEKRARTFLGKCISQVGPAEGLAIIRAARNTQDAQTYIAAAGVRLKLPTDERDLWELRKRIGLPAFYEDEESCHAEIRAHLRDNPDLRAAV